jgi:hypothetical protein
MVQKPAISKHLLLVIEECRINVNSLRIFYTRSTVGLSACRRESETNKDEEFYLNEIPTMQGGLF